jgi:hypothetical protein
LWQAPQNPDNFGSFGIVRRPVQFRSGIHYPISTAASAGTDVFIINVTGTELNASEVLALEKFVNQGGALMEMRSFSPLLRVCTPWHLSRRAGLLWVSPIHHRVKQRKQCQESILVRREQCQGSASGLRRGK